MMSDAMIITLAGSIIGLCFAIIGFFLKRFLLDIKNLELYFKNMADEAAKTRSKLELVEQQQINDIRRIEAMTQLELKQLTNNVNDLSMNVKALVMSLAKRGID
jgi:adenylosuccinate lyase